MSGPFVIRAARPTDVDAIARVHVASWRANYRGLISDDLIDARTFEVRKLEWSKHLEQSGPVTLVACDESGVQGFANALVLTKPTGGFTSFLQTLYLAPEITHQGCGRALLRAIAADLVGLGAKNMALRTLRTSPARGFYEHLGARLIPEGIDIDADEFDDVDYGFDDLRVLLQ
jgi:GNAT superfamily N-acetyltransferase